MHTSSASGTSNYEHMKDFVKEMVHSMDYTPINLQFSVVKVGNSPQIEFNFEAHYTKEALFEGIENISFTSGPTLIAESLDMARQLSHPDEGSWYYAQQAVIYISDGTSHESPLDIAAAANKLKLVNGNVIFSISVGNAVSDTQMTSIASCPKSMFKHKVNSYDEIRTTVQKIIPILCHLNNPVAVP